MSISLKVRYSGPADELEHEAYPLRLEVTEATGMPTKVFVFQARVPSATDPQANRQPDEFKCVANPVTLDQYPEDAPDLANNIPYYRTDAVDLVFTSMLTLNEAVILFDAKFRRLVASLRALEGLKVITETTYV